MFEVASFVHQHEPRNVPKCPSASFLGSFLGWALEWFLSGSCCVPGRPSFQDEVSSRHRAGQLGMGRTGDSLLNQFPPRSGG